MKRTAHFTAGRPKPPFNFPGGSHSRSVDERRSNGPKGCRAQAAASVRPRAGGVWHRQNGRHMSELRRRAHSSPSSQGGAPLQLLHCHHQGLAPGLAPSPLPTGRAQALLPSLSQRGVPGRGREAASERGLPLCPTAPPACCARWQGQRARRLSGPAPAPWERASTMAAPAAGPPLLVSD